MTLKDDISRHEVNEVRSTTESTLWNSHNELFCKYLFLIFHCDSCSEQPSYTKTLTSTSLYITQLFRYTNTKFKTDQYYSKKMHIVYKILST